MTCNCKLSLLAGVFTALPAVAAEERAVDTDAWVCETCPVYQGVMGDVAVGIGYVADDAEQFGNYTGLGDRGGYFGAGADLLYQDPDGRYWELRADDLGIDARTLEAEGGWQGRATARVFYNEIPRVGAVGAQTPYRGAGGSELGLPPGWTPAGRTDAMPDLGGALHRIAIEQERQAAGVALSFVASPRVTYGIDVRRDTKSGLKATGGAVLFSTAILPEPVDYTTDRMEANVAYQGEGWGARLAYEASFFRNDHRSLTWENAFTPIGGADQGQLALAPDNEFHQVSAAANYRFSERTVAFASLAVGRMLQDERFLPYTVNGDIAAAALPRERLDGEVRTRTAVLRVNSRVSDEVDVHASYRFHERDNRTPQATYEYVLTDAFLAGTRTNLPYSFEDSTLALGADVRIAPHQRLSATAERVTQERERLEVEETVEDRAKVRWRGPVGEMVEGGLSLGIGTRDGSAYETVESIDPPQNPLLRKFNMADRRRKEVGVSLSGAGEKVGVTVAADYRLDDYDESPVGLQESSSTNYSVDLTYTFSENLVGYGFVSRERLDSEQAGAANFGAPDWRASEVDKVTTFGVGADWAVKPDKLNLGLEYTLSDAAGKIRMHGGANGDFPALDTRIDTLRLTGKYVVSEKLSVNAALAYEHYRTSDWAVDGVAPDTIPVVLSLGEESPDYDVLTAVVYLRYRL